MSDAAERERQLTDEGIEHLGQIADKVESLHNRSRVTFYLLGGMALLLVAVVFVGYKTWQQGQTNADQREDLEQVVANQRQVITHLKTTQRQQQAQAEKVILEACRSRNEANRQIRGEFRRAYLNVYRLGPRDPERRAAIQELIDGIPTPEMQDRDCNGDDVISRLDYPPRG